MKRFGLFIAFLIMCFSVNAQQFLWSTTGEFGDRQVSLDNVAREALLFYDQFDYYYDFTGFTRDSFVESFGDDWDWVHEIDGLLALALRMNVGGGSAVYVFIIGKDSVNVVIFSNVIDSNSNITYQDRRARFETWFKSLLN